MTPYTYKYTVLLMRAIHLCIPNIPEFAAGRKKCQKFPSGMIVCRLTNCVYTCVMPTSVALRAALGGVKKKDMQIVQKKKINFPCETYN
jgi:hypothetical protein